MPVFHCVSERISCRASNVPVREENINPDSQLLHAVYSRSSLLTISNNDSGDASGVLSGQNIPKMKNAPSAYCIHRQIIASFETLETALQQRT